MRVGAHLGVSVDVFVSTADGWPVMLSMPEFAGRESMLRLKLKSERSFADGAVELLYSL